jgi:hypothetical protein
MRLFLEDLARLTGILGPHDGSDGNWRFLHRTFREFLVAEELHSKFENSNDLVLMHALDVRGYEDWWGESYALMMEKLKEPADFIKQLFQANEALGVYAAGSQQVGVGNLRELLTLTNPADREVVFVSQVGQIGESGRETATDVGLLRLASERNIKVIKNTG